jgi:segregation and condensation protein B
MEPDDRKRVLELLLFLADRPLRLQELAEVMGEESPGEEVLRADLNGLAADLDARQSPLHLLEIAQGWQLASRPAFSQWVRRLFKQKTTLRLSPSALETLSIVAYKQPITRGEIEEIRGVEVGGVMDTLLERKLARIVGRKEALGRPLLYGTTLEFMKQFGLKSLDELPRLEELVPPEPAAEETSPAPSAPAPEAVAAPVEETPSEAKS